jgi:hypothetical protein
VRPFALERGQVATRQRLADATQLKRTFRRRAGLLRAFGIALEIFRSRNQKSARESWEYCFRSLAFSTPTFGSIAFDRAHRGLDTARPTAEAAHLLPFLSRCGGSRGGGGGPVREIAVRRSCRPLHWTFSKEGLCAVHGVFHNGLYRAVVEFGELRMEFLEFAITEAIPHEKRLE